MPEVVPWGSFIVSLTHDLLGNANEEREKAGSLAALGMTNQKNKSKGKGQNNVAAHS